MGLLFWRIQCIKMLTNWVHAFNLCCRLAEVCTGKHRRHSGRHQTWSPETCSPDDWSPGTWGRRETEEDSDAGSSTGLPDETQRLMAQAAADRIPDVMTASVWTVLQQRHKKTKSPMASRLSHSPQHKGATFVAVPRSWAGSEPTLQPSSKEHSLTWVVGHNSHHAFWRLSP